MIPGSICHNEKVKWQLCFVFWVVVYFTECFKQKDSVLTLLQSIQFLSLPRSGTTTNRHILGSGKRSQEQRLALVEPWCEHWSYSGWRKGTSRDEATLNSEEIKPINTWRSDFVGVILTVGTSTCHRRQGRTLLFPTSWAAFMTGMESIMRGLPFNVGKYFFYSITALLWPALKV